MKLNDQRRRLNYSETLENHVSLGWTFKEKVDSRNHGSGLKQRISNEYKNRNCH